MTSAPIRSIPSSSSWPSKRPSILKSPTRMRRRFAPSRMPSTASASTRRQASNLASNLERRVVITGVGLICAVGNTTDSVWQAPLAGKSGIDRITQFDASAFACQIAGEVRNFDPFQFIEKKEVKKMGRFIHFALAAADEAMKMSQLKVTRQCGERRR